MIEKDILTSVKRSEEKGKEILEDAKKKVALLKEAMSKEEAEFVRQLEESFEEKKEEEKKKAKGLIQKENKRIKLEYDEKIKEVENSVSSKSERIIKEILKELMEK